MRFFPLPCLAVGICLLAGAHRDATAQAATAETITIDARSAAQPFPHFWEQMFGSGRAVLSMRESYREDLRQVKQITDFRYVRFHAIFHDEVGVYNEDKQGNAIYNFDYVDQIYDGLLANGVKPFVELSFMPKLLAARLDYHPFWYKPIVSPPADYAKWNALISAFAQHLIDATVSMRWPVGTLRFGTNPTSISGPVGQRRKPIFSFTTTPPEASRQ
jgi:xylan 1,4-beta-xylosidase